MRILGKYLSITLVLLSGFAYLAAAGVLQKRLADCYSPIPPSSLYKKAPGYFVTLAEGYTMQQNFDKVGSIPNAIDFEESGYFAELTDDQIAKICDDDQVKQISDNSYSIFADLGDRNTSTKELQDLDLGVLPRANTPDAGYGLAYLSATRKYPPQPYEYHFLDNAGEGVDIYIVDSGINDLPEFAGRLQRGQSYTADKSFRDVEDHGTRVASFAGGTECGTSKQATLWDYRVADIGRNLKEVSIVNAVRHIRKRDKDRRKRPNYRGAVINISMTALGTPELQKQVERAIRDQIAVVVAAGNKNIDASANALCKYAGVHCAGAINERYDRADFSNYGPHVTIWAPGESVRAYHNSGRRGDDHHGTSFAAPYVAGIIATFYGREGIVDRVRRFPLPKFANTGFDNVKAHARLRTNALESVLGDIPVPNFLANNGFQRGQHGYLGAPEQPPQACNIPRDGHRSDCVTETGAQTGTATTARVAPTGSAPATTAQAEPTTTGPVPWPTDNVQQPIPKEKVDKAIEDFQNACNEVLDKPDDAGKRAGCIMFDQPTQLEGVGDEDLPWINISVEQIWWADGQTSVEDVGGQILYALTQIESECTTDHDQIIGGWAITGSDDKGYLQWNLTGLADKADTPPGFIVGVALEG